MSAQQGYATALLGNERRFAELEQLRRQVRELQRLAGGSDVSKRTKAQLAEQVRVNQQLIETIEKEVADPREADRSPLVRQALVQWIDRRAALIEALLADRSVAANLASRYAELERDPGVLVALGDTSTRRRLGPSRTFELQSAALDKLAASLFGDTLPVYRQHGQWRVSVVLEERSARTLNFSPNATEHLLAASLLESAGISVDAQAPDVVIQTSGGRALHAKRIVLAKFRVGSVVLTNVAAIALPPEGEDLGSVLAGQRLDGYRLEIDEARLQAGLLAAESPQPPDASNR
ncbi:MAG: retropepsin-like aspartic protease [Pirellulales bacterium]